MLEVKVDAASAMAGLASLNPSTMRGRLTSAVRNVIRDGRSEAKSRIERRYTARSPLSLGKVQQRVAGLTGRLIFGGARNSLRDFDVTPVGRPPHNPPGGLHVQVVRGSGGWLRHAFWGKGTVFEREGRSRLPIRHIDTLSLPGMAKAVSDGVVNRMEMRLQRELDVALGG